MKTNKQLCEEYNKITGENVQRFSSKDRGEERIMLAKIKFKPKARKKKKSVVIKSKKVINKIRVDNKNYPSVRSAFKALGLPLNQYRKVLAKLKIQFPINNKVVTFMGYKFKNIVRK